MKTSHINHVVLYAKNFYRHTNNVVKDMQRFMQLDGHRYKTIDTPEKVWKVMRNDYLLWANSLDEEISKDEKQRIIDEVDNMVQWETNEAAHIWSALIRYSIYVPLTSSQLGYPSYDKYHMPQFNIKENLFDHSKSFDDWNKAAAKFLDSTQEERYDEYMNRLMDDFHFEEVAQIFNETGFPEVTAKSLENELWDLYTQFMDENLLEGGVLKAGYFNIESEYFHMSIDTHNYNVSIAVNIIFGSATFTVPGKFEDEVTLRKLFKIASQDDYLINEFITTNQVISKVFKNSARYIIDEKDMDFDIVQNSIADMYREFESDWFHNKLIDIKESGFETWKFAFNVKIKEDCTELSIQHRDIHEYSIMENKLQNTSPVIDGKKY